MYVSFEKENCYENKFQCSLPKSFYVLKMESIIAVRVSTINLIEMLLGVVMTQRK